MAISHEKSKRKATGARVVDYRKKKQHEIGRKPVLTKIAEKQSKEIRVLGGNTKTKLLNIDTANVFNPKTKKASVVKLKTVTENNANRNFVRRNILTKGTVVDTEKGKIRITNRPGQEGTVNGVLVE